jgi:23S rRNA (guanosine2251-2'-O)-methyltransferase
VIVYGRNAVREALRGRREVARVWALPRVASEPWIQGSRLARTSSADELAALCGSDDHQGVCAEVSEYPYADAEHLVAASDPFLVVLDEVQDPQNLGAIARSAECAGATGLVIPERRSAEVTPSVCKASAGAVEHLSVARVRNLTDFLGTAKRAGCWCYGAAAGAGSRPDQVDLRGGVALVLGSEGRGLRPRVAANCDAMLALPMLGRIESLNVSAAAAALLYEAVRQRAAPVGA